MNSIKITQKQYALWYTYYCQYSQKNFHQRKGQAAFNSLHDFHPQLADSVRGKNEDPFYDDRKLQVFFEWLENCVVKNG